MFWKFSYSTSQIQTILEKPDVTLQEILDEDDVIQECKSNNEKLVAFLTQGDNLNQLVSYVVTLPSNEIDERQRFKYSTISSELLTCDISTITDSIISNQELINKLYSFLYNDAPLNPLLASYFARVMGSLITRKTELLLMYLQSKQDFVELLLKHINTSAVMDVLLRLLTTIENSDLKQRVLKWLTDINLIQNLISLFSHKFTNDVHSNVSQLLCDIIRISREQILAQRENQRDAMNYNSTMNNSNDLPSFASSTNIDGVNQQLNEYTFTNPLLDTLESPEVIDKLLDYMFESINAENISLSFGIDVLLTILEPKTSTIEFIFESKNLEADRLFREQERFSIASRGIKNVSNACLVRLKLINELLTSKKLQTIESAKMSYGELAPPLGTTRLNIIKLIAKLIGTNNAKLNEELVHFKILNTILDYVFEYKWNNFLHAQILNILTSIVSANSNQTTNLTNNSFNNLNDKNSNDQIKTEFANGDSNENNDNSELQRSSVILLEHLLKDCHLIERLLKAWSTYFESSSFDQKVGKKSNNAGFIGHLTTISNLISKNSKEGKFSNYLQTYFNNETNKEVSEKWKEFEDMKLTEINRKNTQDLVRNPLISSSTDPDPDPDPEPIGLPNDENMQRKYADYHKDMIPSFPESFGLSDINITNFIGKTPDGFPKLQNITFQSFQMEANDENAQLFDQICSQRDSMREAIGDNDEDVWVAREIKFAETHETEPRVKKEVRSLNLSDDENSSSSSSDEEANQDFNRVNNYRGSGSSKPKSQRINTNNNVNSEETTNNNEIQMEFTNTNDIKATTLNQADDANWADFSKLNNQEIFSNNMQQTESSSTSTNNASSGSSGKNNLSNDEDNNWANFDNFNELTNERCSSPNSTSTLMQTNLPETTASENTNLTANNNQTDTTNRSNSYLPTKAENIKSNEQQITSDETNKLTNHKYELNNSDETPMESTNSIDESSHQKSTKEKSQKNFTMTRTSGFSSSYKSKISSLFTTTNNTINAANITTIPSTSNKFNDNEQNELNKNYLFLSSKGLMRSSEFSSSNKSTNNNEKKENLKTSNTNSAPTTILNTNVVNSTKKTTN